MINRERCKNCELNPQRASDWFYCNNPKDFRDFAVIRISGTWTSTAPKWCLNKDKLC